MGGYRNFREFHILGTSVNKGNKEGRGRVIVRNVEGKVVCPRPDMLPGGQGKEKIRRQAMAMCDFAAGLTTVMRSSVQKNTPRTLGTGARSETGPGLGTSPGKG